MPHKIIVAFKTKVVEGVPTPSFKAPSNYKDDIKIAAFIEAKQRDYHDEALLQPYTATFDEVRIADTVNSDLGRWTSKGREPGGDKAPICVAVKDWLLKRHPNAWPHTTHSGHDAPEAIFVGFNMRLFVKMLGIECSLPENQPTGEDGKRDPRKMNVLPLSMWYTNSDHRDIEKAVIPSGYDNLDWNAVLFRRGLAKKFDKWGGPHVDTEQDLALITELAGQLGMFSEIDELTATIA